MSKHYDTGDWTGQRMEQNLLKSTLFENLMIISNTMQSNLKNMKFKNIKMQFFKYMPFHKYGILIILSFFTGNL